MTFLELISSAFRKIGIAGEGETLSAQMLTDAKESLNLILEEWENDPDLALTTEQTFSSVASTASYVVGNGQTWDGDKPLKIMSAYTTISSVDYPLTVISEKEYMEISIKSNTGIPEYIMYAAAEETGTVYLYPTPADSGTITILSSKAFVQCTDLTADVSLPKGYKSALIYNLAIDLSSEYEISIKPIVAAKAAETLSLIRDSNRKIPAPIKFSYLGRSQRLFNINTR